MFGIHSIADQRDKITGYGAEKPGSLELFGRVATYQESANITEPAKSGLEGSRNGMY